MNNLPYFGNQSDQRFTDILDIFIIGENIDEQSVTFVKEKLERLLYEYCIEDFLGFFVSQNQIFYNIENGDFDEQMREFKTFYIVLNSADDQHKFICEFFAKHTLNEDGSDAIHTFLSIYNVTNTVEYTLASCLSYIASMYANLDSSSDITVRQRRFLNYVSTFRHPANNLFSKVFEALEYDANLKAE